MNKSQELQALLDRSGKSFQQRPELREHLAHASIRALSNQPWKIAMVDELPKRRPLSRGMLLAIAIALSRRWQRGISSKRIGIVLPPGIGGVVANLAVVLAGKIPVNLNFTMGRAALESCLQRGKIETVISATILKQRFTDFPWPQDTLDIVQEINLCGKGKILQWLLAIWCFPLSFLAKKLGIPPLGDDTEAALLFTSGSSGEPKGVVLSHRNIIGNIMQIAAIGVMRKDTVILGCLPIFHSFGFTVTLWYPLLQGIRMVTLPSPLDVKKIAESIHKEGVTLLAGTPTFLRPYLRKAEPHQLTSLQSVIAGAEKLPSDLVQAFEEKFNLPVYEGYGLTETSPVVSVNLPDTTTAEYQHGNRLGSVGRLLPGITARIVDPDTSQEKSLLETGMLHLRGPNIFKGYLDEPERTHQVLRNGWFVTGDLARFDEDGFLFIEGRLSRFSKIGGEMVPHETVEQKIISALGLESMETRPLVIVGIPDESKGEALVLLTTVDISTTSLREKLVTAGLPNLWLPKIIHKIDRVPVLASGKLNLKACQKLASEKCKF